MVDSRAAGRSQMRLGMAGRCRLVGRRWALFPGYRQLFRLPDARPGFLMLQSTPPAANPQLACMNTAINCSGRDDCDLPCRRRNAVCSSCRTSSLPSAPGAAARWVQ